MSNPNCAAKITDFFVCLPLRFQTKSDKNVAYVGPYLDTFNVSMVLPVAGEHPQTPTVDASADYSIYSVRWVKLTSEESAVLTEDDVFEEGVWHQLRVGVQSSFPIVDEPVGYFNGEQVNCRRTSGFKATLSYEYQPLPPAPKITKQPTSVTATLGTTAKFTVKATGGDLSYQWQYKKAGSSTWYNSTSTGNKTATLTVEATAARNGMQFRCIVKNSLGTATSNAAKLTVT